MICRTIMALVLAAGVLAGCKSGSDYYGKGPLVLSSKAEKAIQDYRYGKDGIRENLHIAIEPRLRSIGGVYCPLKELNKCLGEASFPQKAVLSCNKDGKYDCGLYSVDRRIVWQGPVYLRNTRAQQNIPYNGVWPLSVDWPAQGDPAAELVAREGDYTVAGVGGMEPCPLKLDPQERRGGRFTLRCAGGPTVRGRYSSAGGEIWTGEGRDAEGHQMSFRLDTAKGRGPRP